MKKSILSYLKHMGITIVVLLVTAILVGYYLNAGVHYGDHPETKTWKQEGPYAFVQKDSTLRIHYVNGTEKDGYNQLYKEFPYSDSITASAYFLLDSSSFSFSLSNSFTPPAVQYNDGEDILAISDIESGFNSFKEFLIQHRVMNEKYEWTFGKKHLVLVGDFVDRGKSTTQVLWLIYKLEQDAKKVGGHVHFILGNHEIKMLQGNYAASEIKYFYVASVLKKSQFDLYGPNSVMGRWLASKNTIESINGTLFTHGGLHPDLQKNTYSLEEINSLLRSRYRYPYYPSKNTEKHKVLLSARTGPSWYRGYFEGDLEQNTVEAGIVQFNAQQIVVGHTIQKKVKTHFEGKVIAIDVKHPNDYHKNWPYQGSEGILIEKSKVYRLLEDGTKVTLKE